MIRRDDSPKQKHDLTPARAAEQEGMRGAPRGTFDFPAGQMNGWRAWGGSPGPALRSSLAISRLRMGADPAGAVAPSADAPIAESAPAAESTPGREQTAAGSMIAEDGAGAGSGRMEKSAFLAELRAAVTAAAEDAMSGSRWSTRNCPWIEHWFDYYQGRSAGQVEAAIRKYAPGGAVADVREYIPRVSRRVHHAVSIWVRTGRVTGVPQEMSGESLAPAGDAGKIQAKAIGNDVQERIDPAGVRDQLGPGTAIGGELGSRFGSAFGRSLGDVRVHTDANAAGLNTRLGARAFAVGDHIAFGRGEFRPGTPYGDGLIAHELAHVIQQRGATTENAGVANDRMLERDAEQATAGVMTRLHGGAAPAGISAAPTISSGLSLQRCSLQEKAPVEYLTTPKMKADWISGVMANPKTLASVEVMKVFRSTTSTADVIEIEEHLDMVKLVELLKDDKWDVVYLGSLAPVPASAAAAFNEVRADYIVDMLDDFGAARAEVISHFVFSTIPTNDDVDGVLKILARRKKLENTVGAMKSVQGVLTARGINLKNYADRSWNFGDVGRGVGHAVSSYLDSGDLGSMGKTSRYQGARADLPESYTKILDQVDKQEMAAALDPSNLLLGMADYVLLNVPSGIYGTVSSAVKGISDLSKGKVEEGSAELFPAVLLLVSLLGVKVMKAGASASTTNALAEMAGPEGPGQFTIKGFEGPIPKDVARLQSLMALNEEAQITAGLLVERLGKDRVTLAAQYVRANREAMLFVEKEGMPALEQLVKSNGDVAAARAALQKAPKLLALKSSSGRTFVVRSTAEALEIVAREGWEADAMHPGALPDNVAGNFAGGKYNKGVVQPGQKFYKGGNAENPGGSYSNFEPPKSVAEVRIDNAVKPYWPDNNGMVKIERAEEGHLYTKAKSPVNALIEIDYPAGTEFYYGPVSSQGGVYLGGQSVMQIYVPNSFVIGKFTVIGPLK